MVVLWIPTSHVLLNTGVSKTSWNAAGLRLFDHSLYNQGSVVIKKIVHFFHYLKIYFQGIQICADVVSMKPTKLCNKLLEYVLGDANFKLSIVY